MTRKATRSEVPALGALDRQAGQLSRQLTQALRQAIHNGSLQPGEMLPSTRRLAQALQLARGTVTEAYEQLVAEGFLVSRRGSGTCVTPLQQAAPPPACVPPCAAPPLSAQAHAFAQAAGRIVTLPAAPFAVSEPVGAAAPDEVWRTLGNRLRSRGAGAPAGYAAPHGAWPLRQAVAEYVRTSRSVQCSPEQVIITAGIQQGLALSAQILLDAGDAAWVEDPGYPGITALFESACRDRRMVRVPVDAEGLDVQAGQALAPHARAAFVTPSHQYPLGMPMSMSRRNALISWARAQQAWIVEDDYDSEFRYTGHPFPALQGLAPSQVIYLGTFSKILFPSLRLGYAVVPDALIDAFCGARLLMDRHPPGADQTLLAAFMAEGHLARHIRRLRTLYAEKHHDLNLAVAEQIDPALAWLQPCDQGMHRVLWLRESDDREVLPRALAAGVAVRAISPMYADGRGRSGLLLGLGGYSREQVDAAARTLNRILLATRNKPSA